MTLIARTVQKSSIIDQILNWANRKADKELKKTDGKGRNRYVVVHDYMHMHA